MDIKEKYPGCWSIAYREARYFLYHRYKVLEDKEFILQLIKLKDYDTLDYMENFYALLREDQTCNKDISSRVFGKPLEDGVKKKISKMYIYNILASYPKNIRWWLITPLGMLGRGP